MDRDMLNRITDGRTDLVFDLFAAGHAATSVSGGASLINWCAYYGDVSGVRFLLANGESYNRWASWYARPDSVLRLLCYGEFSIRPKRRSMASYLLGEPHIQ